MRKLLVLAVASLVALVLVSPAGAHQGHAKTKQGTEVTDTNCVGGGCFFQYQSDGDLKLQNQWPESRARGWWDFTIPTGHFYDQPNSEISVANSANCNSAGYEAWVTFPATRTLRLHIRINNIGSCTVQWIRIEFRS